jgi:Ser/Thr protein kinase RdoA (MazF antagonist)
VSAAPDEVVAAWPWAGCEVAPLAGGLINQTFVVRRAEDPSQPIAVLQRLHHAFAPEVNDDLDAVTTHLAAKGLITPRLLRTEDGRAWTTHDDHVWRALTWVDGETVHAVPSPDWAAAGGALVGRFHVAIADLAYRYRHVRAGVHDTAAHLARLRAIVTAGAREQVEASPHRAELDAGLDVADQVLAAARTLPPLLATPSRHVHGDLKISNLLFTRAPVAGRCLVDLDTLGKGTLAFELGDAMRSWCNPHGEDGGAVAFELPIFAAAIGAFREVAGAIVSPEELASIVVGLETVCLELAARFAIDVFDDSYFGWDASRFASRRAHDLVRARGQLALGLAVQAARRDALDVALAGT